MIVVNGINLLTDPCPAPLADVAGCSLRRSRDPGVHHKVPVRARCLGDFGSACMLCSLEVRDHGIPSPTGGGWIDIQHCRSLVHTPLTSGLFFMHQNETRIWKTIEKEPDHGSTG